MSVGKLVLCTGLVFSVITVSAGFEKQHTPRNHYFNGVEDRLAEADAVVVGRAEIIQQKSARKALQKEVTACIYVTNVLKGDKSLREIEYNSPYYPRGFTSFSGEGYWSIEDEMHARLIECFPYALGRSVIFFLKKRQDGIWEPFYVYLDDDDQTVKSALEAIIAAQEHLNEWPSAEILCPMLDSKRPLLVRKYAVRSVMRRTETWPEQKNMLLKMRGHLGDNDEFYTYTMACVVAHLRYKSPVLNASRGLDLVIALINQAPNVNSLNSAVDEVMKLAMIFREDHDMAKKLRNAILTKRNIITEQKDGAVILNPKDKILFENIGMPISDNVEGMIN